MKKHFFCYLLLSSLLFSANAQEKIKKYCEVSVGQFYFGKHFGWKDSTFLKYSTDIVEYTSNKDSDISLLKKVTAYKTLVDVLNYMSDIGWTPISGFPIYEEWGDNNKLHQQRIIFFKEFLKDN